MVCGCLIGTKLDESMTAMGLTAVVLKCSKICCRIALGNVLKTRSNILKTTSVLCYVDVSAFSIDVDYL